MNRPHAPGSPHSLAQALRRGLSTRPFSEDTIQWGIVAAVHGSTNTMLTSAASAGDTTIYTAAAPLVNDLLVIGDTPTTTAPRVTAVTGSGPYTVTVQPELPATLTTGTSVTALPTIDVYLNGAQNPTPASSLTWGVGVAYGTTAPTVGSVVPLFRGIGGLKSDRFALSPGGGWIITGSGPPAATLTPPVATLYLDTTNGGAYQYTVGGWTQVGGFDASFFGAYPGVVSGYLSPTEPLTILTTGPTGASLTLVGATEPYAELAVGENTWVAGDDGGFELPAADDLGAEASVVYSSVEAPISGAFGAPGDWDFAGNGNIYYNASGVWVLYGGGSAGWQIATVAAVHSGNPNTVDLTGSTSGVPCLTSYIPYVGDTVEVALSTGYGTSGKVVQGSLVTQGSQPLYGTITVPAGVTHAQFTLAGAMGGGTYGGQGSLLVATIPVVPLSTIYLTPQADLVQGGGNGAAENGAGNGGGAADVRIGGSTLSNRVLVAAGGGGEGSNATGTYGGGGEGGGLTGPAGSGGAGPTPGLPQGGVGATSSGGGAGGTVTGGYGGGPGDDGTSGAGGDGAVGNQADNHYGGGGGGDGLYGGGGGACTSGNDLGTSIGGGGGGGIDYAESTATGVTDTPGAGGQAGYTPPGGAPGSGWINVVWLP